MYIISKFHDYYDVIMKQGMDKSLVYQRNEEVFHNIRVKYPSHYQLYQELLKKSVHGTVNLPSLKGVYRNCLSLKPGLLGFCGKQYLIMMCVHHQDREERFVAASGSYQRWTHKLKAWTPINSKKSAYQFVESSLMEKGKYKTSYFERNELKITQENILTTLEEQNSLKLNDELFIELNCPIFFIYDNWTLIKDPPLQEIDFQCLFSPEECFQEISHYLGNVLTKRDNPAQITDNKILCAAKGFDVKTSFRKLPTKH